MSVRVPSKTFETVQGQGWRAKKSDGSCREGFEGFEGATQQFRNPTESSAGSTPKNPGCLPTRSLGALPPRSLEALRSLWCLPTRCVWCCKKVKRLQDWRAEKTDGSCREGFEGFEGAIQQFRNPTKSSAGRPRTLGSQQGRLCQRERGVGRCHPAVSTPYTRQVSRRLYGCHPGLSKPYKDRGPKRVMNAAGKGKVFQGFEHAIQQIRNPTKSIAFRLQRRSQRV